LEFEKRQRGKEAKRRRGEEGKMLNSLSTSSFDL